MNTLATARESYFFLSHSGADTEAACEFVKILQRQGVRIWFDQDDLRPGARWMASLEEAILSASGMIVYIGRLGVQAFVDREVRLGLLRNTQDPKGFLFIPVLGEGANPKSLPPFLQQHQWVDLQDRRHAPERIQKLVQAIKAGSPSEGSIIPSDYWVHHSPFRSLQAFEPDDSWLFFGRDSETDELLAALNAAPVLAVVGNSGCGKSSLVRGGLIPALRHRRFCSESSWLDSWRIAVFRPTASPFDFLAETIPNQLAADMSLRERAEFIAYCRQELPSTSGALRDVLCALPGVTSRTRFLLVVDQFEEIFTGTNDPNVRQRYIDSLLLAARTEGAVPVHLVLVLRADFYGRCLEHAELSRALQLNLYNVPHMAAAQSREAIENRLALAMSRAEPGLISSMLAEVGLEPANLALLEHALGQLWIKCGGCPCTLTNLAYEEIGRLRGAVGRHADLVYKKLSEEQKFLAQRIFVELVHLGHGVEDTRRRVDKDDLLHLGERVQAERLLGELASERLIFISAQGEKSFVEVSHDALIREWPTLRHWLESGREDIQLGRHFLEAAEEWQGVNQDAGALLQGTRLVQGEEWLGKHSDVNPLLRKFLQTSIEVERAKELRQAFRTKRTWLTAMAVVLLVAVVAVWGERRAAKQRDIAQAEQARKQRIEEFVTNLFEGGNEEFGPETDLKAVDVLERGDKEIENLKHDPQTQGDLYETLGAVYQGMGQFERADSLLRSSLQVRRSAFGPDNPQIAKSLVMLSLLRLDQDNFPEAEALARDALGIDRRHLPENDPDTVEAMIALGRALDLHGSHRESMLLLRDAVRSITSNSKISESVMVEAKGSLAHAYFSLGEFETSDSINREVLAIDQRLHGERHPAVANDLIVLAQSQLEYSHYQEAERLYRKALEIRKAWYGQGHVQIAFVNTLLAQALNRQKRFAEAEELLKPALITMERVHGIKHTDVALIYSELGYAAKMRSQWDKAIEYDSKALRIYRDLEDKPHHDVAVSMANLATSYSGKKMYARAERLFREALELYDKIGLSNHVDACIARIRLGMTLAAERRYQDAEKPTLAAYEILIRQTTPSVYWLNVAREQLVSIYEALKMPEKAARYRRELVEPNHDSIRPITVQ